MRKIDFLLSNSEDNHSSASKYRTGITSKFYTTGETELISDESTLIKNLENDKENYDWSANRQIVEMSKNRKKMRKRKTVYKKLRQKKGTKDYRRGTLFTEDAGESRITNSGNLKNLVELAQGKRGISDAFTTRDENWSENFGFTTEDDYDEGRVFNTSFFEEGGNDDGVVGRRNTPYYSNVRRLF